jgi:hypothetical protein
MRPPRLLAKIPPGDSSCATRDFYIKSEGFSKAILHVSNALGSFTSTPETFNNALVSLNYTQINFSNAEESLNSAL